MTKDTHMLAQSVRINGRFMRSARIDMDLAGTPPLEGYVLQASTEKALSAMATSKAETGQCAFTWTGPYGGGKSSTALLVGNLIAGEAKSRKLARKIAGPALVTLFDKAFPKQAAPWQIVPVTGSRTGMRGAIAAQAANAFGWSKPMARKAAADDGALVDALKKQTERSGVVLILDELGKFLEAAAGRDHDAHLLQDLAEISARSDGRLVVIGILHQSFEAYADKVSASAQSEWAKIQGRFQDLSFLSAADETVRLLGRAIETTNTPKCAEIQAGALAAYVAQRRPSDEADLAAALSRAWPLNPICALMLGGITRRRFGQNERSVFGFLASGEPGGFSEFLARTHIDAAKTYNPAQLWDYLNQNFGLTLAAGPQSTQYNLALEAIDRAGAKGKMLHQEIAKSAALIELFKNGSGLGIDLKSLALALPDAYKREISKALSELCDWGVLLGPTKTGDYALFTGSDFDIQAEIERVKAPADIEAYQVAVSVSAQSPIAAKRHYFDTGVLRAFDLMIADLSDALDVSALVRAAEKKAAKSSGIMLLLLHEKPRISAGEKRRKEELEAAFRNAGLIFAAATMPDTNLISDDAAELGALARIQTALPQLAGDQIARRAVRARISKLRNRIAIAIQNAVHKAVWTSPMAKTKSLGAGIQSAVSNLSDIAFPSAPLIKSELLQKDRPSSSAAAALRFLMHAMVNHGDKKNLGFEGYPAALGLYLTVLAPLGLHVVIEEQFRFSAPGSSEAGKSARAAWTVLADCDRMDLESIYETWSKPPFGMKRGVMPVLALAFILARRDQIAVYQDNLFQTSIDEVFVDRLLQTPASVTLRKASRDERQSAFLSKLANGLGCSSDSALIVAKALFGRVERLTNYALRTQRISSEARQIRDTIRRADDPENLLFDALPGLKIQGDLTDEILNALDETEQAYPKLLQELRETVAHAVGVDADRFEGVAARAKSVIRISSDLKFDAYAQRLAGFEGGGGDIESFASPLQDKPVRDWSDRNRDGAVFEIATFARQFKQAEAVASVLKRKSGTEAISLIVGVNPNEAPLVQSFELSPKEQKTAETLAESILAELSHNQEGQELQLAALARAVAALTQSEETV